MCLTKEDWGLIWDNYAALIAVDRLLKTTGNVSAIMTTNITEAAKENN